MNTIIEVDDFRFSLNGVNYLKNYISRPYGNKLEVFNCYERKDVLIEQVHYNQFTVDGATFGSVAALQNALLHVLFNRSSLSDGTFPDATAVVKGKLRLGNDLGGTAQNPTVPALLLKLPIEVPGTSSTVIMFLQDRIHGTIAAPITGAITKNVAGAKFGVTVMVIHKAAANPMTADPHFRKYNGSQDYIPNVNNFIYMVFLDAEHINYSIQQTP